MTDFRETESWKIARSLVCVLLDVTDASSRSALPEPVAREIRHLSISLLDTIARGYEGKDSRTCLAEAQRSIRLLEQQLVRARDAATLNKTQADPVVHMLNDLRRSLGS